MVQPNIIPQTTLADKIGPVQEKEVPATIRNSFYVMLLSSAILTTVAATANDGPEVLLKVATPILYLATFIVGLRMYLSSKPAGRHPMLERVIYNPWR